MQPSVSELTRIAILAGHSPSKWIEILAKLQHHPAVLLVDHEQDFLGSGICDAIFTLIPSYGSAMLLPYLRIALLNNVLSPTTFIVHFIQNYRVPDSVSLESVTSLAQTFLEAQSASQQALTLPPSIIPDALLLLKSTYSFAHLLFDISLQSISQAVVMALSNITNISVIADQQARRSYELCSEILHEYHLPSEAKLALESLLCSLGSLIGDAGLPEIPRQHLENPIKVHDKLIVASPNGSSHCVGLLLLMNHMVRLRGTAVGSASTNALNSFVSFFRASQLSLVDRYNQLFTAALESLIRAETSHQLTFRNFVLGRLPAIIKGIESQLHSEFSNGDETDGVVNVALAEVFQNKDELLNRCDVICEQFSSGSPRDDRHSFRAQFVCALIRSGVVDAGPTLTLLPRSTTLMTSIMYEEAQENGIPVEDHVTSQLSPEIGDETFRTFVSKVCMDFQSHQLVAQVIITHLFSLLKSRTLEFLHHLSKVLLAEERLLDLVSLHTSLSNVVAHVLDFLENYDTASAGDPQTTLSCLGSLALLAQVVTQRYQLRSDNFTIDGKECSLSFLQIHPAHPRPLSLRRDCKLFSAWINALFDRNSEGIEDHLLRATQPSLLLSFAPALVSYAAAALQARFIDADALRSGLSYFQGSLLNWTLVRVINSLVTDITRHGLLTPFHFEVLISLLSTGDTRHLRPVVQCCGAALHRVLTDPRKDLLKARFKFDDSRIQIIIKLFFSVASSTSVIDNQKIQWAELPRLNIQRAIADDDGFINIDLAAGLHTLDPINYLNVFWTELSMAAHLGNLVRLKEIATFVLVVKMSPPYPPLLPLFLTKTVPHFIVGFDGQQTMGETAITLLASVIASSLLYARHQKDVDDLPYYPSNLANQFFLKLSEVKMRGVDSLSRQILLYPTFQLYFDVKH